MILKTVVIDDAQMHEMMNDACCNIKPANPVQNSERMVEAICPDFKEHVFIEKEKNFHGKSKTIFRARI